MGGGQRALVPRVHRLEHVEGLASADLPHDDPIRAHAKRVATRSRTVTSPRPSTFGGPRLKRHDVWLREAQLGRVLDRDEALVLGDEAAQHTQQRGLA